MSHGVDDYALALQLQQQYDSEFSESTQDRRHILGDNTGSIGSDDQILALRMQAQFSDIEFVGENYASKPSTEAISINNDSDHRNMSLVDPKWELIDPNPDVRMLFLQFNDRFFWGKLSSVEVRWSPRMTLCAGLCVYEGHGGLCSVRLSTPLLKLRPRKDLIETLLHEMIHAYLFVTDNNKDHDGHGPEFHKHMHRINGETGTNISVYHNFHDEVASYKQHWWRCDGPCRTKPPYHGYVKRAMNRAPSAQDFWWGSHVQTCGGTYTKVKEPEGYGEKKKKTNESTKNKDKSAKVSENIDIRSMFDKKDIGNRTQASSATFTSDSTDKNKVNGKRASSATVTSDSADRNKENPHEGKKKVNIAGFVRDESGNGLNVYKDRTHTNIDKPFMSSGGKVGVNLAGFQRSQDGLQVYKTDDKKVSVASSPEYFKGEGKLIGGDQCLQPQRINHIVRKLPGFGVIENERPVFSQQDKIQENTKEPEMDSDDPECVIFSPTKNKSKTIMNKVTSISTNSKYTNVSTTPLIDLSDSDSEFDNILKNLPKKKKKFKPIAGNVTLDKFVTREDSDIVKFKSGFKSVSQKGNTITKGSDIDKSKSGFKSVSGKSNAISIKGKNKIEDGIATMKSNIDFTAGRNKRAHDLDRSSDDTDNEIDMLEKQSLASVFRKRQRRKSPELEGTSTSFNQSQVNNSAHDRDTESTENNKVPCPVCQTKVDSTLINQHLDTCLS